MAHRSFDPDALTFDRDGAQWLHGSVIGAIGAIERAIGDVPTEQAGVRLHGIAELASLLTPSFQIGRIAAAVLGEDCRAVRALLLDKSEGTNWSLAWHQDRTVAVKKRREVEGFGPWTVKRGLQHVAPPYALLADMVTLRVHMDPVPATNAPLLIAPGSHRLGRIAEGDIAKVVRQCGAAACIAEAGDVWLYSTPILHASEAAAKPARRRVLQIDYARGDLPGGLEWMGL